MDQITKIPTADNRITVLGRTVKTLNRGLRFSYPGVSLNFKFIGKSAFVVADSSTGNNYLEIVIDGKIHEVVSVARGETPIILTSDDEPIEHQVSIVHRTETWQGTVTLSNIVITNGDILAPPVLPERKLLIIGDSVTCGEAIDREPACGKNSRWWNPRQSYGMLLAAQLDAQVHLVCYGGRGLVRDWQGNKNVFNAPQFFDLAIPDESHPVKWDHQRFQPDMVLISLGTNDFNLAIGALPERTEFVSIYTGFIEKILTTYTKSQIAITEGAIVNDQSDPARPQKTVLVDYINEAINQVGNDRVVYIPSNHYPGDDCDGHPTKAQHAAMSDDLAPLLRQIMHW